MGNRLGAKRTKPYEFHIPPRKCAFPGCDNTFIPNNSNNRYCSEDHWYDCEICGNPILFKPGRKDKRTCSKSCATQLRMRTSCKNHGGVHHMQDPEVREQCKRTCKLHYGVEFPQQSSDVRKKSRQTSFLHYGVPCPMQSEALKARVNKTMQARAGVNWPCELPQCRSSSRAISKVNRQYAELFSACGISMEFEFRIGSYIYDLHVCNTNVVIELNPTATHNTYMNPWGAAVSPLYHYNKTRCANQNGFMCIHVFDWMNPVDTFLHLRYCKSFEVMESTVTLHWYNERTQEHLLDDSYDFATMIEQGYLPVYDDGMIINFLYEGVNVDG